MLIMNNKNKSSTAVSSLKPQNFNPSVEVAACYMESNGKLLLLKRAPEKPEGNRWGVPAGKIENDENPRTAVLRETHEETGIQLEPEQLHYLGKLFISKPGIDFVYHMFHYKCSHFPSVSLNHEHTSFQWTSLQKALNMPIMTCGIETLHYFQIFSNKSQT